MNQHTRLESGPIPFIDVAAQRRRLGRSIDDAVARVLAHCQFIQGPEVRTLEVDLAAFCGARHVIACSSGTDALLLILMAWEIGPGDAVICPTFTFHATAEMVALLGATPVLADVQADTFNIDPESLQRAIATAKRLGLKPRAVIPVDLFGLPADHDAIAAIAAEHGLLVLDDAAQAFGANYRGRKLGALATATATAGRCSRTTTRSRRGSRACASMARAWTSMIPCVLGSTGGSIPSRPPCSSKSSRYFPRKSLRATKLRRGIRPLWPKSRRCRALATNQPRYGRNTPSGSHPDGATHWLRPLRRKGFPRRFITPSRCIASKRIATAPWRRAVRR